MPRQRAAAGTVTLTPGEEQPKPRKGVAQPIPGVTRRLTRSVARPDDLIDPGGPGSFRGKSDGIQPTIREQAEPRVSQTAIAQSATQLEQDHRVLPTVESAETRSKSSGITRGSTEVHSTEGSGSVAEDDLEVFYQTIGYLPPLDDATIEVLEFLSLSDPNMDTEASRISASKQTKVFRKGLEVYRNVDTSATDPGEDELSQKVKGFEIATEEESQDVADYRNKLWKHDLKKCTDESSEKILQRTIMMAMIDRCRLVYGSNHLTASSDNSTNKPLLDFAVESTWNCPPMPTKAVKKFEKLLTRPMPDLAIAFRRDSLFSSKQSWEVFPSATQKIMFYEGIGLEDTYRAFHFLTIEAKKAYTGVDDQVAIYQSLNNASQALHNMYEFFREADMGIDEQGDEIEKGDKYKRIFFDEVRFFSVVATARAMKIRIHRACSQEPSMVPIVEGYPLEFKFEDYTTIDGGGEFARQKVVEELAKILLGYGVKQLGVRLQEAVKEVEGKFQAHWRKGDGDFPRSDDFYSHGLYQHLMHLAQINKQKRAAGSGRTSETRSQTPRNTTRHGQQPASQSHSLSASQLRISVSSDATSGGQAATSESATSSREEAAETEQEGSETGRGKRRKKEK